MSNFILYIVYSRRYFRCKQRDVDDTISREITLPFCKPIHTDDVAKIEREGSKLECRVPQKEAPWHCLHIEPKQ